MAVAFNDVAPGLTIRLTTSIGITDYRLAGIVYYGGLHFTARYIDSDLTVWFNDGMVQRRRAAGEGPAQQVNLATDPNGKTPDTLIYAMVQVAGRQRTRIHNFNSIGCLSNSLRPGTTVLYMLDILTNDAAGPSAPTIPSNKSMKLYYLHTGLQVRDAFFGNRQRIYTRSASITDWYPGRVLLEAERRYTNDLVRHGVKKLSLCCGWHLSLKNQKYHYTLRGYNRQGWMALTLEMEGGNQGQVYAYGRCDWKRWSWKARANRQGRPGGKLFFNPSDHVELGIQQYKLIYDESRLDILVTAALISAIRDIGGAGSGTSISTRASVLWRQVYPVIVSRAYNFMPW
ncbi:hypothetical protein EDD18DRAFT_1114649 [Armillaria luteobubalina]|uniref:Uncharacterized protein n=1 Tax=Armillaria luteobubalina TaxID=153913 RepID=A0AA39P549_9AGAR|nr:hypothetical protein EDD18DRAFT_1114649 [Armillaria luteobubalina]